MEDTLARREPRLFRKQVPDDDSPWETAIQKAEASIVSLCYTHTRPLDCSDAYSGCATGFVVDAEKGYILTNRHVAGPGPFWGHAVFHSQEECEVRVLYLDPLHDFAILRFDTGAIKHQNLAAIELRPDLARLRCEIRVIGNDTGLRLSIAAGTISRLDLNPEFEEPYHDFNTHYIQAAILAAEGSSGSPVINKDGYAVGIVCASYWSGTISTFLPLDRPLRALELLREGRPISRGTLQMQWCLQPFHKCQRFGLTQDLEGKVRDCFQGATSMIVAQQILPGTAAARLLRQGDILYMVNGSLVISLIQLEAVLDDNVGGQIDLRIQRAGKDVDITIDVENLCQLAPTRFLEVCDAYFHDVSFQQAHRYSIPTKGVCLVRKAGIFRLLGETDDKYASWIIDCINHEPILQLDDLITAIQKIVDGSKIVVKARNMAKMDREETTVVIMSHRPFRSLVEAVRSDKSGLWDYKDLMEPFTRAFSLPVTAEYPDVTEFYGGRAAKALKSFVWVQCTLPIPIDGCRLSSTGGYGFVINAEEGEMIVSRAYVPHDLCDLQISIANSAIIPATVKFLHPSANYAILKYDPSSVCSNVRAVQLSGSAIYSGMKGKLLGASQGMYSFSVYTAKVLRNRRRSLPMYTPPRYSPYDIETFDLDSTLHHRDGLFLDDRGYVAGLIMPVLVEDEEKDSYAFDASALMLTQGQLTPNINPNGRILGATIGPITLHEARGMGLSQSWIDKIQESSKLSHLAMVEDVTCPLVGTTNHYSLQLEDIVLELDDAPVTDLGVLDEITDSSTYDVLLLRDGQEIRCSIPTIPLNDLRTRHVLQFCGATIQPPHFAVRRGVARLQSEVYISYLCPGSPAEYYDLEIGSFIIAVNSQPTLDLSSFRGAVLSLSDDEFFRLDLVTIQGHALALQMKKNLREFPTREFKMEDGNWTSSYLESLDLVSR